MGWVTLTLRKTELKRTHADYQKQLLDISREKRRMAREYHYQQTVAQNDQQDELNSLYASYKTERDAAQSAMQGAVGEDGKVDQAAYNDAQQQLNNAKEQYELMKNNAKTEWYRCLQQTWNKTCLCHTIQRSSQSHRAFLFGFSGKF